MFVLILKPQTGTRVIACVFFYTNNLWINQWSLHVCSFHKLHVDPLESLYVCSYTKTSTRVIACVFFHQSHMDQPVVIACVFFSTNHTWINQCHCMCVLSTNHIWINQWSLHVCSFHKPLMDPLESLH